MIRGGAANDVHVESAWPVILVLTNKSYSDWLNSSSTVSTVSM